MAQESLHVDDDGLMTPEVGDWAEEKYALVAYYAEMFATSMKDKWDCRVYIDLFSGAGHARIKDTSRIVRSSPMLALRIIDKFDRYIFCDADKHKLHALKIRVRTAHPGVDAKFLPGDSNKMTAQILKEIPKPGPRHKVLTFCFVDPCKMRNLQLQTLAALAQYYMDFLILIPTWMDANRNTSSYIKPSNKNR